MRAIEAQRTAHAVSQGKCCNAEGVLSGGNPKSRVLSQFLSCRGRAAA
jgi:hypothetical protein